MIANRLSSNERLIIKKIALAQIESFTRLSDKDDPVISEMLEIYNDEPDLRLDIQFELVSAMIDFERVFQEPEFLFELDKRNLTAALFIIGHAVSEEKYPKTKKSLITKLSTTINSLNSLN